MAKAAAEILFVGTGDGLAIYRARAAQGGVACELLRRALEGMRVEAIAAADAQTLLVAVAGGPPQQSFDGGETWSQAPGAPPEPIGLRVATTRGPVALANPRLAGATAYARLAGSPPTLAGAGADGSMLFRSQDDGIHWEPAGITGGPRGRVAAIAPSATRPGVAWAGTAEGALLYTGDRALTWRAVAQERDAILCLASVPADEE